MEIPCVLGFLEKKNGWKISKLIKELGFDNKSEGREDKSSESTDASGIAEYEPVKKQAKMDNDTIVLVKSPVQGEDTTINVWVQCDMCTLSFKD